jgi:hypothetical protein
MPSIIARNIIGHLDLLEFKRLQDRILHRKSCLFITFNISISTEKDTKLNNDNFANYVAV